MARTKKNRLIQMAPHYSGFKPLGLIYHNKETIIIHFEEYEALKLCDYEHLTQAEAAELMNISRPTLTRIYESVRKKVAKAFVEGLSISFEGGDTDIAEWYRCDICQTIFTLEEGKECCCPLCRNKMITLNNPEL